MKLLYLLLVIMMITVLTIVVFVILGYVGYQIYYNAKTMAENVTQKYNSTINITDYDLIAKLNPFFIILDLALIVAFIFMIIAVFMHSAKR